MKGAYTFAEHVKDRRAYIAAYLLFGLLTVAVVQLDLRISGASLKFVNVAYLFLLGVVGLVFYLWYDYRKAARYFKRLSESAAAESVDQMGVLAEPRSMSKRTTRTRGSGFTLACGESSPRSAERGRRRVHVLTQWAHHMKTPVSVISLELQRAGETGAADQALSRASPRRRTASTTCSRCF